jgi:hypothetical protein
LLKQKKKNAQPLKNSSPKTKQKSGSSCSSANIRRPVNFAAGENASAAESRRLMAQ